uniref:YqaJ viral recombinase domain-containing protein n=1 Tax=Amphimedon queenslandica TaxID=400682 RepID=A0A1X7TMM0_AMPQE
MPVSGLIIDSNLSFLGATSDGFSHCDCCGDSIIEIKCPYSVRDLSPTSDEDLEKHHFLLRKIMIL